MMPSIALAAAVTAGQVWSPPQTPLPTMAPVPRSDTPARVTPPAPAAKTQRYQVPPVNLPKAGTTAVALPAASAPAARTPTASAAATGGAMAARVGTSPLYIARAATGSAAPSTVQVKFADPAQARKDGFRSGLLFSISRQDAVAAAGKVSVQLDTRQLAGEAGGNYGQRLTLEQLPACALTTPSLPQCQTATPVATHTDAATGRLAITANLPATTPPTGTRSTLAAQAQTTATSSARAGLVVFTAQAIPAGSAGTFAATSLQPSDQWSAGGSSGDFSYSYPVTVPDSIGGTAPTVALSYASSSVDGETVSTNTQPSVVGDGFAGLSSYIERAYQPCSQDGVTGSTDSCWGYGGHEVTVSGGALGGRLVWDDTHTTWHLSGDNGASIQLLTGAANNAYNGEYWMVTLQDGTRLYYGAGKLPTSEGGTGTDKATNSVSTEPIYCPNSKDCDGAATGTGAFTANMPYRWNLDLVVDPHGNATEYTYTQETNSYGRGTAHTPASYDRSAYLNSISYGWRTSNIAAEGATPAPAAQVQFTYGPRCLVGSIIGTHTVTSTDCASPTSTSAPYWPDVPQDQVCAGTGSTCPNTSPSFFSEVRLTQIDTRVNTGTTSTTNYQPVDSYALTQSYPPTGDGTSSSLRLESVLRTGKDGADLPLKQVSFVYAQMTNRVAGAASWPAMDHYRITAVNTETGGVINVTYSAPDCNQSASAPDLPTPSSDTRMCYQEYWTPPNSTLTSDWFEKYRVMQVMQSDAVGGSKAQYTSYTYPNPPAWHRNDSPLIPNTQRTWDQFRGYDKVITQTGHAPDPITQTVTTYLRGMDGDSQSTTGGSPRSVQVTDSIGDSVTDSNQLAGYTLETQTYTQASGTVTRTAISLPWSSKTASHSETATGLPAGVPDEQAYMVKPQTIIARSLLADGTTWRTTKTVSLYDSTTGLISQVDAQGDTSLLGTSASQETCATNTYATPPASGLNTGMTALPAEAIKVVVTTGSGVGTGACPARTPANTVADTRDSYDGSASPGVIPATGVGDVTKMESLGGWSGSTENFTTTMTANAATVSTPGYDAYGRLLSSVNAHQVTVTDAYTPASGTLPTSQSEVNVTAGNWKQTTTLDQRRQLPVEVVDANNATIWEAYDSLGRLTSVWLPGRAHTATASKVFSYYVGGASGPSWTRTQVLRDDATYTSEYQIYDGFMQLLQDQSLSVDSANSNGSVVTDRAYDSHGWLVKKSSPYYITSAPSSTFYPTTDANVPAQTVTTYDLAHQSTTATLFSYSHAQSATTTTAAGADRTDISTPQGGNATSTVTDALGRTTAVWTYRSNTGTGNPADATVLSYAYTRGLSSTGGAAVLTKTTDASGHVWTTTTDAQGNQVAATDPDAGSSSATYDASGQLLTSTDGRGQVLSYTYDPLGRKAAQYQGTTQTAANELASWTYDSATNGKGLPASSTSYYSGNAYTESTGGYTLLGAPTSTTVTIPAAEGGLAGTYTTSYSYSAISGRLTFTTYGADGGLPGETVATTYTEGGTVLNVGGNADYLTQVITNPLGQVTRATYGDMPDQVVQTNFYDTATARPTEQILDKETGTGHVDDTTTYWNLAGKVAAQQDIQDNSAATDTQCYTYDAQGRLATAWTDTKGTTSAASPSIPNIGGCTSTTPSAATNGGPAPYWESYTYDASGNRTQLTSYNTTGTVTATQTSTYPSAVTGTTGQPDTVQSTSTATTSGTTATSYAYDTAGNTTGRTVTAPGGATTSNETLSYDPAGRTSKVTDSVANSTAGYQYDASGALLLQKDTTTTSGTTGTSTVLYLPGEQLTMNYAGGITAQRYYDAGGALSVIRDNTGAITYEAATNQGTGNLTLNSTLTTQTRRSFTPYGTSRGTTPATWVDNHAFLNQPADPTTGLDLLGVRNYDSATGHFLQRDPILEATDPNQLGGYTYSGDDPVNGSDPNGLCSGNGVFGPPCPTGPPPDANGNGTAATGGGGCCANQGSGGSSGGSGVPTGSGGGGDLNSGGSTGGGGGGGTSGGGNGVGGPKGPPAQRPATAASTGPQYTVQTASDCRGNQSCLIGFYASLVGLQQQAALAREDARNSCATKACYDQTLAAPAYTVVNNTIVTNVAVAKAQAVAKAAWEAANPPTPKVVPKVNSGGCGWNLLCQTEKHWRGIVQVVIVTAAIVATGACALATAGVCAGAGGILIDAAIGAAAGVGQYETGAGEHTLDGAVQAGAISALEYAGAATMGKLGLLLSTTSKALTISEIGYNFSVKGGRFWYSGNYTREVFNHMGFGTRFVD